MLYQAVVRIFLQLGRCLLVNLLLIEALGVLSDVAVAAEGGNDKLTVLPADSGVGEKRQQRSVGLRLIGGGIDGCVRRGHESGHSRNLRAAVIRIFIQQGSFAALRLDAHWQSARQDKQLAALRQRNQLIRQRLTKLTRAAPGHFQAVIVKNLALAVGEDQRGPLHQAHQSSAPERSLDSTESTAA